MAKAFTEQERKTIDGRLRRAAAELMQTTGIRKTTVQELAGRSGISKGAFYQFYGTKEELFFAAITECHERVEADLMSRIAALDELSPASFAAILTRTFREVDATFLPRVLMGSEMEYLMLKLPEAVLASHQKEDGGFISRILAPFAAADATRGAGSSAGLSDERAAHYAGAFRALFMLLLHKREVGAVDFFAVMETLIAALTERLFAEAKR